MFKCGLGEEQRPHARRDNNINNKIRYVTKERKEAEDNSYISNAGHNF